MTHFQTQLIKDAGFSAEEHTVVTEDGYLLTIHRCVQIIWREICMFMTEPTEILSLLSYIIPHRIVAAGNGPKPVVFLQVLKRRHPFILLVQTCFCEEWNLASPREISNFSVVFESQIMLSARTPLLLGRLGDWWSRQSFWFPPRRCWLWRLAGQL